MSLGIKIVGRVQRRVGRCVGRANILGERDRNAKVVGLSLISESSICSCRFDIWSHTSHHTFGARQGKYGTMTDSDFSITSLWPAAWHIVAYKPSQNQSKEEETQMEDRLKSHHHEFVDASYICVGMYTAVYSEKETKGMNWMSAFILTLVYLWLPVRHVVARNSTFTRRKEVESSETYISPIS